MAKKTVEAMVEGGKATPAPPLGPSLAPLKVNINEVIVQINEKTKDYKGMKVPVKVTVDTDTKEFKITIGSPPTSQLLKKEAGIEKGAAKPQEEFVADMAIEQIIKVAKMKIEILAARDLKAAVVTVIGTCNSMGMMVEGKKARDAIKEVKEGKFDKEIKEEKTELTAEEVMRLQEERKELMERLQKERADILKKAHEIASSMKGKEKSKIENKLIDESIPKDVIKQVLDEIAKEEAAAAAAPAEGAAAKKEVKEEKKEEPKKKE